MVTPSLMRRFAIYKRQPLFPYHTIGNFFFFRRHCRNNRKQHHTSLQLSCFAVTDPHVVSSHSRGLSHLERRRQAGSVVELTCVDPCIIELLWALMLVLRRQSLCRGILPWICDLCNIVLVYFARAFCVKVTINVPRDICDIRLILLAFFEIRDITNSTKSR